MDSALLTRRLAELGHTGEAGAAGQPLLTPASAEQAADLLGTCSREGWRVRLLGAGTREIAADDADLTISARALTGFDIYEPDDLTVGVRAGTPHLEVVGRLARHQQLLPLDPYGRPEATLGGAFAAGQAGPLRAGYGTPRDLALGLTLVTGDGRVLTLGGQVVKNVAGYDLVRLAVGSRGTIGFITRVHVRLRSLPPSDITLVAPLSDGALAASLALEVRDRAGPVAVEVLTPEGPAAPWQLALRLHGSPETTAAAAATIQQVVPAALALDPAAAAAFWRRLAEAEAAAAVRFRYTALPGALPDLLATLVRTANSQSGGVLQAWQGAAHATDGILRLWLAQTSSPPDPALPPFLAELARTVLNANGTCICERGPGAWREQYPGASPSPRLLQLERELRLRFDPASILVGA